MRQPAPTRQPSGRLWITGASGLLGNALCNQRSDWDVLGLHNSRTVPAAGVASARIDLTDYRSVKALLQKSPPDVVIHCAAISDPGICERDPRAARRVNVDATVNLAGLCADREVPFVFTSSDLVFDGTRAPYREADPVNPVSFYGEQKVVAEAGVLRAHPAAAICRLPLLFGLRAGLPAGALRGLIGAPTADSVRLFVDEYRTPVSTATAAAGLLIALCRHRGLLHLGGGERISRYDFGCLCAEVFEVAQARLLPCSQADLKLMPRRPPDVSLDITKARQLGYSPPALSEQLQAVRNERIEGGAEP